MKSKTLAGCFCLCLAVTAAGFEAKQQEKSIIVSGKRIELTVKDARITAVRNLENGAVLTSDKSISMHAAGLGNMTGQAKELSRVHFPWGEPNIRQNRQRTKTPIYGHAGEKTKMSVKQSKDSLTVTWKGLYFGKEFAADDSITLEFSEDENGALVLKRSGKGREGVFGVSVPVDRLAPDGKLFLPTFGGVEYAATSKDNRQELIGLQDTTLFFEAPLMIYVRDRNAFGMWVEDAKFRPYFGLIERSPAGSAFTLEGLNVIPYEKLTSAEPPPVKLDVFKDSGWIAAARPFRNWYHKAFAKEIAIRDDKNSWADKIMVIADGGNSAPGYERLPKIFDPETVLVQVWQARKLGFTTGIPDYTPRGHYPDVVKSVHKAGMKVMCYVCSLCAVYKCAAWEKDHVGDFFLTRKNSVSNYRGKKSAFDENLVGTQREAKGNDQFGHLKPGAFLYGDPLSRGWHEYFGNKIKEMNDLCGTDANYQDTLGCASDNGNGFVDGRAGSEGNIEFARHLQKVPGVPMAAEFGPAPIAFAIRWPLNNSRGWGKKTFRDYRTFHQVPLTPFLFGYRSWVPSIRLTDDEVRHCILSVSDSVSGFGMIPTGINPEAKKGFTGQMLTRAKLFSSRMLRPYYPEKIYPENIRSMYQDKDGKLYKYYNDGKLQKMIGPDGKAIYARLHGAAELNDPELFLPDHPIWDKDGIYALNPKSYYALVPRENTKQTSVHTGKLPDGVYVKSYYELPNYAYLELGSTEKDRTLNAEFMVDSRFSSMILNGREQPCSGGQVRISGKLPLKAVFFDGKEMKPDRMLYVNALSGMLEGKPARLPTPRKIAGQTMYLIPTTKKRVVNMIVKVPSADSAIRLSLINQQKRFGDGAVVELSINGEKIHSFDCAKWDGKGRKDENSYIFDNRFRTWTVPVGQYAGQFIFVTAAVDWKQGNNADLQFISVPELVSDPGQKFSEKFSETIDLKKVRPKGEPVSVMEPAWKTPGKKGKGAVLCDKFLPLDASKTYFLSGEFKSASGKPVRVHFGMAEWDAKGQIQGVHVNGVPESETMLNHEAKAGDKYIFVFDASKWSAKGMVALGGVKDGSDLPNRNLIGPITKVELMGGDYKVTLKSPLKKDIPSETPARCHIPRETFEYVAVFTAKDEFVKAAGRVPVLPKANRGKVIIISPEPLEFRDIKLEAFDK
ncbi:MAG: hypothetical protein IJS14_10770 [Lentisphaeria bacterium]|nr:hypothetical protein [Lentisphaeria bacterium]